MKKQQVHCLDVKPGHVYEVSSPFGRIVMVIHKHEGQFIHGRLEEAVIHRHCGMPKGMPIRLRKGNSTFYAT